MRYLPPLLTNSCNTKRPSCQIDGRSKCRSMSDDHVHLVVRAGTLDVLPRLVRDQGPWPLVKRGEIGQKSETLLGGVFADAPDRGPVLRSAPLKVIAGPSGVGVALDPTPQDAGVDLPAIAGDFLEGVLQWAAI